MEPQQVDVVSLALLHFQPLLSIADPYRQQRFFHAPATAFARLITKACPSVSAWTIGNMPRASYLEHTPLY